MFERRAIYSIKETLEDIQKPDGIILIAVSELHLYGNEKYI